MPSIVPLVSVTAGVTVAKLFCTIFAPAPLMLMLLLLLIEPPAAPMTSVPALTSVAPV